MRVGPEHPCCVGARLSVWLDDDRLASGCGGTHQAQNIIKIPGPPHVADARRILSSL